MMTSRKELSVYELNNYKSLKNITFYILLIFILTFLNGIFHIIELNEKAYYVYFIITSFIFPLNNSLLIYTASSLKKINIYLTIILSLITLIISIGFIFLTMIYTVFSSLGNYETVYVNKTKNQRIEYRVYGGGAYDSSNDFKSEYVLLYDFPPIFSYPQVINLNEIDMTEWERYDAK